MKQILYIHGGTTFSSYDAYLESLRTSPVVYERMLKAPKWRDWLADTVVDADVLMPDFPNKQNAQYEEWKILFEKLLPFLKGEVALVGYSLGAMFLAKYLHDTPLAHPVSKIILIAPGYNDSSNEDLGSFEVKSAKGVEKSAKEVHLFHSQDDPVVPFSELEKFTADIPNANVHVFNDRGHFFQPTFPELLEVL